MVELSSWGRLSNHAHSVCELADRRSLGQAVSGRSSGDFAPGLAFGMGRSYGDVCLNGGGTVWKTTGLNRLIQFNASTGVLTCEAGVLLKDISQLFTPRGWALPVTPGTQLITVGGAIANDIHGKNHHREGTFGSHVRSLRLHRTDGETINCGPQENADWFAATLGGIGLTGVISQAELQLIRIPGAWLTTETIPYRGMDEFLELADGSEAEWEHTVSWIDCLSGEAARGLFMRGNRIESNQKNPPSRSKSVPFTPPLSLVNRLSLKPLNAAYYALNRIKPRKSTVHYQQFFYPLDNLLEWNRLYGPAGFFQYQSVVPRSCAADATRAMLAEIARSGEGSFLAVLKTLGDRPSCGLLSFVQPGVTLALDFPNRGASTLNLLSKLDAIVEQAGGRIYLAKDARMPRSLFEKTYPKLGEFAAFRDPGISSEMSRRLMGS